MSKRGLNSMPGIPSDTPLSDRAIFYRARAAVAQEFALRFRSRDLKESYLTIAQNWAELAAETERSFAAERFAARRPLEVSPRLMRHWEAANCNTGV
jgi:hypothetical protein